ncbi:MAG TPA: hypothetical protein DDE71_06350 [Tenacibaculum sp.]|nr:hypothetical protein [Tenacibaculum sp.]
MSKDHKGGWGKGKKLRSREISLTCIRTPVNKCIVRYSKIQKEKLLIIKMWPTMIYFNSSC